MKRREEKKEEKELIRERKTKNITNVGEKTQKRGKK